MNIDVAGFEREGWTRVSGLFDAAEMQRMHGEVQRYITQVASKLDSTEVFYEDRNRPASLKQMPRMEEHDSYFAALMVDPRLNAVAATLLGPNPTPRGLQYFAKPPVEGQPTPAHQDGFYMKIAPLEALTLWVSLDAIDESNGCIRYVPGSHRRGMREHRRTAVLGFSQGMTDFGDADRAAEVAVRTQPGDVVAHHCMLIHRADGNTRTRPRRALGVVYHAAHVKRDEEAVRKYQEQLHADLAKSQRI